MATATPLLALLILGGHQAYATPSTTTGSPDAGCACWTTGTATVTDLPRTSVSPPTDPAAGYASIVARPYAPTGRMTFVPVVPRQSASGDTASPFDTVSTLSRPIVFDHAKPGKLAAVTSGWSNAGGTSVYVGTSSSLVLRDGGAGASQSSQYSVNPTGTVSPHDSLGHGGFTATAYIPDSENSSRGDSAGKASLSRSVEASGPVYANSIAGSGAINPPKPRTRSLLDFGTIELNATHTLQLSIMNLAKDQGGSASDLTIEGYTITGADSGSFSDALAPGSAIAEGGTLLVPLIVVGTGPGDLTSSLTIFTNEGTALGGAGEAFNYLLNPMVVAGFSTAAPEPASLAVLGVALAGLAAVRRRRTR